MKKKCIALCIGINEYDNVNDYPTLKNAESDASAIAEKLTGLKYEVCAEIGNITYEKYLQDWGAFLLKLEGKVDVAIVYIAGHGFMANGSDCIALKNTPSYLENGGIPAKGKSIDIKSLCEDMRSGGNQINIIIIDACRKEIGSSYRGGYTSKPFGQNTIIPYQTYIAFATTPGAGAKDGIDGHSPYTEALLEEMDKKDQPIEYTFKNIRKALFKKIGDQLPWENSCLIDEFSFNYGQLAPFYGKPYHDYCYNRSLFIPQDETIGEIYSLLNTDDNESHYKGIHLLMRNKATLPKEILFIMGRMISFSINKGSGFLIGWIKPSSLKLFSQNNENHLLNGILFEMYFDEYGTVRKRILANRHILNIVALLCEDKQYKSSCDFISEELKDAKTSDFLYVPGEKNTITVSLKSEDTNLVDLNHHTIYCLTSLHVNDKEYDISDLSIDRIINRDILFTILGNYLQIPNFLLKISSNHNKMDNTFICYPIKDFETELVRILQTHEWEKTEIPNSFYINSINHLCIKSLRKEGGTLLIIGQTDLIIDKEETSKKSSQQENIPCEFTAELTLQDDLWIPTHIKEVLLNSHE